MRGLMRITFNNYRAILKYPLEHTEDYKGWITFQTYKETPPTINTNGASVDTGGNIFDIISDIKNLFPELTITGAGAVGASELGDMICLNLPTAIQIQDRVQFDNNAALGASGANFEAAANAGVSDVAALALKTAAGISDVGDLLGQLNGPQSGDIGRLLASLGAQRVGTRFGNAVSNTLRTTTNPNIRAIFRSVSPREHSFAFKFLPRSVQEADNIEFIIREFKRQLYPESIRVKGVPIGYKFPNKFLIRMLYGDIDKEIEEVPFDRSVFNEGNGVRYVADRLLPCYLTNMSTTFNPQTAAFYRSGHFVETDLTLTFSEVRALAKEDLYNGFDDFGRTAGIENTYDLLSELNINPGGNTPPIYNPDIPGPQ